MAIYTKNGSIPTELPEGVTEEEHLANGWIIAPDKPGCPVGKEIVWLNWEWVIRDPQPTPVDGFQWNWDHSDMKWVNLPYIQNSMPTLESTQIPAITATELGTLVSTQLSALSSTQISALTN